MCVARELEERLYSTASCNATLLHFYYSCNIMLLSVVDCGFPPLIDNGSPGTPTRTTYQGTVTYTCVSGYEVSNRVTTATATCMANGMWETVPTCSRM